MSLFIWLYPINIKTAADLTWSRTIFLWQLTCCKFCTKKNVITWYLKKNTNSNRNIYIYICKLTKRRYQIELTLLLQLCDPFPPLCLILHKAKKSKFIQINLINSKHFSSSQYLLNKRIHDKKHLRFQCYVHLL